MNGLPYDVESLLGKALTPNKASSKPTKSYIYQSNISNIWNNYCYAITISPKGTLNETCITCGNKQDISSDAQFQHFELLMELLIDKFPKISLHMFTEYYKDNHNLHHHGILKVDNERILRKIKSYIRNHYNVEKDNRNILKIDRITDLDGWLQYITKENDTQLLYQPIFYYSEKSYKQLKPLKVSKLPESVKHLRKCKIADCDICLHFKHRQNIMNQYKYIFSIKNI